MIPLTFNVPFSSKPEPLVGDLRSKVGAVVSTLNTKDSLNPSPFSFLPYILIVWSPSDILVNSTGIDFVFVNVPVFVSSPSSVHVPVTSISDKATKLMFDESYVSYITVFSVTFPFSSLTFSTLPTWYFFWLALRVKVALLGSFKVMSLENVSSP